MMYGIAKKHGVINISMGNNKMHTQDRNQRMLHRTGALLVHGLNGSLYDMEELTGFLASYGIVTLNALLPGHGSRARDRRPVDWSECSHAIRRELQKLKQWCEHVFLIGHSSGGALCLYVAASEPVTGIITMCAPIYIYPWMFPAMRLLKHFTPASPDVHEDLRSYEARRRYTHQMRSKSPLAPVETALHHLPSLRTALPSVTAPALIMTAIHDHVVPASDAQAIYRLIGSQEKYLVKFRRSYHLLMKDHDREEVFARTLHFIQSHTHRV
jgi:carboxylesterase